RQSEALRRARRLASVLAAELERSAALELPLVARPGRCVGVDHPGGAEVRAELVDREPYQLPAARRDAIDVVEAGAPVVPVLAAGEDPGRLLALDRLVPDLVPAPRARGDDCLVPGEDHAADHEREQRQRQQDLPDAHAARAHGDELVLARQEPEANQPT